MEQDHLDDLWRAFRQTPTEEAFDALYRAAAPLVQSIAWQTAHDADWADDIFAAVFARLWLQRAERGLPPGCGPRAALVRWTFNEARTMNRRRWKSASRETPLDNALALSANAASPADAAARCELGEKLRAALSTLPEKYREALIACEIEGMTHAEAAATLGLNSRTVQTRVRRGRAMLERKLRAAGITLSGAIVLACVGDAATAQAAVAAIPPASEIIARADSIVAGLPAHTTASFGISAGGFIAAAVVAVAIIGGAVALVMNGGTNNATNASAANQQPNAIASVANSADAASIRVTESETDDAIGSGISSEGPDSENVEESTTSHVSSTGDGVDSNALSIAIDEEPEVEIAYTITGRVVAAESNSPIDGARVSVPYAEWETAELELTDMLSALHGSSRITTTTDSQGRFEIGIPSILTGENAAPLIEVSAAGRTTIRGFAIDTVLRENRDGHVFQLARGATISGIVENQMGAPVANAQVGSLFLEEPDMTAFMTGFIYSTSSISLTDEEGRFTLAEIEQGKSYEIDVISDQYAPAIVEGVPAGVSDLVVTLGDDGPRITGRVLYGEKPVANAKVKATRMGNEGVMSFRTLMRQPDSVTTNANGEFEIRKLWEGKWSVSANGGDIGHPDLYRAGTTIELAESAHEHVELVYPALSTIRGRVILAESEQPISGIEISPTIFPQGGTHAVTETPVGTVLTDADGRFEIQSGQLQFYLRPPDDYTDPSAVHGLTAVMRQEGGQYWAPLHSNLTQEEVVISFKQVDRVMVTVLRSDDLRAANAVVQQVEGSTRNANENGIIGLAKPTRSWNTFIASIGSERAVFRIKAGEEGPIEVRTQPAGSISGYAQPIDLFEGELIMIEYKYCFDSECSETTDYNPDGMFITLVQKDGSFRRDQLPAGHWIATLRTGSDYGVSPADPLRFEIKPGEHKSDLFIELDWGNTLSGVVLDPNDQPLARADVTVTIRQEAQGTSNTASRKTYADGIFAIDLGKGATASRLEVLHDDYMIYHLDSPSTDEPVVVVLQPRASIIIEVVDMDGNPWPVAEDPVTLNSVSHREAAHYSPRRPMHASSAHRLTDSHRHEYRALDRGRFTIHATSASGASGQPVTFDIPTEDDVIRVPIARPQ